MNKKTFFYIYPAILSLFLVCACGDSGSNVPSSELDESTKKTLENVIKIEEAIFNLEGVSRGEWVLALVGKQETILGDLCPDGSSDCEYKSEHFAKLVKGNSNYDALGTDIQALIDKANTYFAGDVTVYTTDGINAVKVDAPLNDIKPELGAHELSLIPRKLRKPLHKAGYGFNYWLSSAAPLRLEAFSHSEYYDFCVQLMCGSACCQ